MRIPSDLAIRSLHERLAPNPTALDLVHTHCVIVAEIAAQLIARDRLDVDADLVRAGCLVHDIGVYRLYRPDGSLDHANYLQHGILGHELLRDLGFPEQLCRFCSCHTGVGITRDDILRQSLPLPPADYIAQTAEERLVMYADKFHSKSTPPKFLTAATYQSEVIRFGHDKAATFAAMVTDYGEPDLELLAATHGHVLV
ncbi:HDIG domain-containing protein [Actinoplanes sp. KI2]|uniref:HD domain-containing protein n=1 Tax=Actinoplanes sp. KI2 TaxID=2983315 RepID=UPI0021D5CE00|nr:HD domain-containing protein [Actinoplanes sp. KI2]MCU7729278.1 HDIG domain-containing protein [Actinoplanes sp. KI2]